MNYQTFHIHLRAALGQAREHRCCGCGLQAGSWAYDHEDPNEIIDESGRRYSTDVDRYFPLCGRCHYRFDAPYSRHPTRTCLRFPDYPSEAAVESAKQLNLWPPPARLATYRPE